MVSFSTSRFRAFLIPLAVALAAATLTALAYWPGLMTWDARRQYGQALDANYDDWHPPAMEWLWRQLIPLHAGPAPMLVLQLALYWGGLTLLSVWAVRRRRPGLATAILACGMLPLAMALMGAVLKDCLMAGALALAVGLLALIGDRRAPLARLAGIALLVFAAMLRFNALLACLPVMVALLPAVARRTGPRLLLATLVSAALLAAAMPVANRLIGAKRSGVELSLVIFDLGGITAHSGVDVFPPMGVRDPVEANRACYSPVKWDPYSDWIDPPCPLGFVPFRAAQRAQGFDPEAVWLHAIVAHPLAYAAHRLAHFNINTRFLVHDEVERPIQVESAPNDWGYRVTPGPVLSAIDAAARLTARTALGWPAVWLALAFAALVAGPALPSRPLIVPLALSSLLYGFGYAGLSVASELRYHLWTGIAALLASVIVLSDLAALSTKPWRRLVWAIVPLAIVLALGTIWRF